jgi:hypothetical protein
MAVELDAARIDAIVQNVSDRLPGDWLLIGGGLAALWFDARRVTEDVDLVGIEGTGADRLSLLGLAHDLGLPVESVNSAADFFVHRIPDWREQLQLFRVGRTLLDRCRSDALSFDGDRVLAAMAALPATNDAELSARRSRLAEALRA